MKWSDETVEKVARKICGAWGYLWDGHEEDGQVAPEISEPYDERPSKQLYREAAKAALAAVAQSKEVRELVEALERIAANGGLTLTSFPSKNYGEYHAREALKRFTEASDGK